MSHHDSTGRDRSARRGENNGRNDPPRPYVSPNIENDTDGDEHTSDPPLLPEIRTQAPGDPIHLIREHHPALPTPSTRPSDSRPHYVKKPEHVFVRRSRRAPRDHPDRAHDLEMKHEHGEEHKSKKSDYSMPSIRQNYRPPPAQPPVSSTSYAADAMPSGNLAFASTAQARLRRQHLRHSHIASASSSEVSGGGGGEDIQTSAAKQAESTPRNLNSIVICVYRNSRRKFEQRRIWLVKKNFRDEARYNPQFFRTDASFFNEIRRRYRTQLRGTLGRYISFKFVTTANILEYGNFRFGLADFNQKMFSPVFMKAYDNPADTLLDPEKSKWIKFFWLNRRDRVIDEEVDLAIELLEDYDPNRVMGAIAVALFVYFALTIVWLAKGGDPGYVAGVMSFVLSILAVMVGLTGLYDWLDLGHMGGGKEFQFLDRGDVEAARRDPWGRGPV